METLCPKTEAARLAELRDFDILDSSPEPGFNRIVRLTARMFRAPFAAISFVDEYRRWYKARYGLLGPKEGPREETFCSRTILSDEVLVVENASQDQLSARYPLVTGAASVRFYAGAPLLSSAGVRLGALCIMDRLPRRLTKTERADLAEMAKLVITELRHRSAHTRVQVEIDRRKNTERTLDKQHRLLRRLSNSLNENVRRRTTELTRVNRSLRAEIKQRQRVERECLNFLGLVEQSSAFIGFATLEGLPQYINAAGRRMLGAGSLKEAVRNPILDYFRPEDLDFVQHTALRIADEAGHWEGTCYFRHFVTGALIPVICHVFYIRDPDSGQRVSLACIATDISEHRRVEAALRESEERFHHLIAQAGDACFICDLDGRIVDANEAAANSSGYFRRELIGLPLSKVEATFNPLEALPSWRCAEVGHVEVVRGTHRRKDGSTFPVESRISLIQTDGSQFLLALVRDVTERERVELALEAAKEQAENASRAKSDFLSRMSHELRTPLNAILGFGQILRSSVADEAQANCASQIVSAGHHLLGLINEVLDISRIEAGRVDLAMERIGADSLVTEAVELIRPQALARGIKLEVSLKGCAGASLLADRRRCKQVLLNLLSNALKYSPEEGRVRIDGCLRTPGTVRISVTDQGPGISTDKLARLFTAFDRLGAERTPVPGTGLGLALSKHLAEAMGGSVGVSSRLGRGSRFWLELSSQSDGTSVTGAPALTPLPLALLRADSFDATAVRHIPGTHLILCVEENPADLRALETQAYSLPHVRLVVAKSCAEGLKFARQLQPSLVILALSGSESATWRMLRRLQAGTRTRGIPVVALSADQDTASLERLIKAGARARLKKPLDMRELDRLLPSLGLRRGPVSSPIHPGLN